MPRCFDCNALVNDDYIGPHTVSCGYWDGREDQRPTDASASGAFTFDRTKHNEACIAHAIGCAVQSVRDAMKEILRREAKGEIGVRINQRNPWEEANVVDLAIEWLMDGTVSCYCEMRPSDWTSPDHPASFECLTLGYVAIGITHRPDVTGRI